MQEQQQQHLKMLGTTGSLAYYGLHLPQQTMNVITTEGDFCSPKGNDACMVPLGQAVQISPQTSSRIPTSISLLDHSLQTTSSMSLIDHSSQTNTLIDPLDVSSTSRNTMPSSVSISTLPNTNNFNPSSSTSYTNNSGVDNASNSIFSSASNDENLCRTTESSDSSSTVCGMVGNVSSSTSKASTSNDKYNEFGCQKSPPPPSRMVTRSQTAAERMQSSFEERTKEDENPKLKKLKSNSEFDEFSSPRVKRELFTTSGIVFDDFSYAKNPAGAGIEFGAVCSDCGAVAVTGVGWNAHQQAHRNEEAICVYCNQVFLTDHGRLIHQQLHRDGQTRDVDDYCECGICGGSFISVMYLELHLLELHGREALCQQNAVHLGPSASADTSCPPEDESGHQLFKCGVCQSCFTFSLNLDCHMALHSEVSYCCALCDVAFSTLDPLVNHSKAHRYNFQAPTTSVPVQIPQSPAPLRPQNYQPVSNVHMWKAQPNKFNPRVVPPMPQGLISPPGNQTCHHVPVMGHPPVAVPMSTVPSTSAGAMTSSSTQPINPTVMAPILNPPMMPTLNSMMSPPIAPAVTPVMAAPMTPAMLNYYMMMTLWGNNKNCANNQGSIPMFQNYMNPPMSNVFNYFNPYLLNSNNINNVNNDSNNTDNNDNSINNDYSQNNFYNSDSSKDIDVKSVLEDCNTEESPVEDPIG